MASRSAQIIVGLLLLLAQPVWAQTIGGACSGSGSSVNGVLLSGRYTDLVCDGMTWQERESNSTGSSSTAAKSLLQIGTDNGSCTAVKQGRMTYNSETDTACYCSGSAWTKYGGTGTSCNDSYASNTVLLVKTNGVNAATNNTFVDSSANNFTITRNGNVTQGMFSPFNAGGGSIYNPSGSYLSVPYNSTLNFGSNDFTIQAWIYLPSLPTTGTGTDGWFVIASYGQATGNPRWVWHLDNRSSQGQPGLSFGIVNGSGGIDLGFTQGSMSGWAINTWYHVAVIRSGNTWTMYRNGTQIASTTSSAVMAAPTNNGFYIGKEPHIAYGLFAGYISNLEIANTARYKAAFTAPTSPLAPDANTVLLLKGENAAIADVTRNNDIETVGTVSVSTAVTKNGEATIYFNGGYLKIPSRAIYDMGTSNFTIDGWFYSTLTSFANYPGIIGRHPTSGNWAKTQWTLSLGPNMGSLGLNIGNGSNNWLNPGPGYSGTISANAWHYFALVHNAGVRKLYIDSVSVATSSSAPSMEYVNNPQPIYIGNAGGTDGFTGYMYDIRMAPGGARYTSTFTPPVGPMSAP